MTSLDAWVALSNIARFRELASMATTVERKHLLNGLLTAELAKLAAVSRRRP